MTKQKRSSSRPVLLNAVRLRDLLVRSQQSPEQLGARMGISGMSIRRWMGDASKRRPGSGIPLGYEGPLARALYELLSEGRLSMEDATAREVLSREAPSFFAASLNQLCGGLVPPGNPQDPEAWIGILNAIGQNPQKQEFITEAIRTQKMSRFEKLGADWKARIRELRAVLSDPNVPRLHWGVAVGALFYLLNPYDLIPDFVPFAGLLDDLATLEAARLYYRRWFPNSGL
jgi:uncharacterized membrane protein YkvA (DUF1232 family)